MGTYYQQVPGTTSEASGDRVVVLDGDGRTLTTLNPTGATVWRSLATPSELEDLTASLHALHPDIDRDRLRQDAVAFVDQLLAAELIAAVDAER